MVYGSAPAGTLNTSRQLPRLWAKSGLDLIAFRPAKYPAHEDPIWATSGSASGPSVSPAFNSPKASSHVTSRTTTSTLLFPGKLL